MHFLHALSGGRLPPPRRQCACCAKATRCQREQSDDEERRQRGLGRRRAGAGLGSIGSGPRPKDELVYFLHTTCHAFGAAGIDA